MSFSTRPGESVEEAADRLVGEFGNSFEKLLEPIPPTGTVPHRTGESLERYGKWLCRHKVGGKSIRSLAISEFGSPDRRKDVNYGLKRAEDLLDMTLYTWQKEQSSDAAI